MEGSLLEPAGFVVVIGCAVATRKNKGSQKARLSSGRKWGSNDEALHGMVQNSQNIMCIYMYIYIYVLAYIHRPTLHVDACMRTFIYTSEIHIIYVYLFLIYIYIYKYIYIYIYICFMAWPLRRLPVLTPGKLLLVESPPLMLGLTCIKREANRRVAPLRRAK